LIYLDSSALVKRYIEEDGSGAVDRLLADHPFAATSRLAYPEILSALNRKHRAKEISARVLAGLIAEFDEELLPIVKRSIRKHAIRGADAVHLASGIRLRSALKEDVVFACADAKLLDAARAERLLAVDPARLPAGSAP
jgi:predicted nucleic acid-binding protein